MRFTWNDGPWKVGHFIPPTASRANPRREDPFVSVRMGPTHDMVGPDEHCQRPKLQCRAEKVLTEWLPRAHGKFTLRELIRVFQDARDTWIGGWGQRLGPKTSEELLRELTLLLLGPKDGSTHERLGMQPSLEQRMKDLIRSAMTARLHEDLAETEHIRNTALARLQVQKSAMLAADLFQCHMCAKKLAGKRARCTGCRFAGYCDSSCQKRDWGRHKKVCGRMAELKRRPTLGEMFRSVADLDSSGELGPKMLPFILRFGEDYDDQLGMLTACYSGAIVRAIFRTRNGVVQAIFPGETSHLDILKFPFAKSERLRITGVEISSETVQSMLEVTIPRSEQNHCRKCGVRHGAILMHSVCMCLICADCLSRLSLRDKCVCGKKLSEFWLVEEEETERLLSFPPRGSRQSDHLPPRLGRSPNLIGSSARAIHEDRALQRATDGAWSPGQK